MGDIKLGFVESKFADIIWENEPLSSRELVDKANDVLGWNKSTTYTILRRLCERGIFINDNGKVTSVISKSEFFAVQSEQFVEDTFSGSLPAFLAAFTQRKKLSKQELDEIQRMIDKAREE